jgi:hypothetical protein
MMARVRIPPIVQMGTTQLSSLYSQIMHTVETSVAYPDPDPDPPDPHFMDLDPSIIKQK